MKYVTLTQERNRRLTAAVRRRMERDRLHCANDRMLREVLSSPVDRGFFVSVDHILVMDRRRREGKLPARMSDSTRLMWAEIFSIIDRYRADQPGRTLTDAAAHVVADGCASRYYLTLENARRILRKNNISL